MIEENFEDKIIIDQEDPQIIPQNILSELQEEDLKTEQEINALQEFENKTYNIKFNKTLDYPTQIKPRDPSYNEKVEVFSIKYEKYDNILAAAYSNGYISIFSLDTHKYKYMKASEYPVTSIRWKPHFESKPKNILVSVTADGKITHWHTATGKALHTMEEHDNPIMCLDFSNDGDLFATAGNDKLVRLYDDNTKTLLNIMKPGNWNEPGHSNRIFCLNFHKENSNLLVSGGWDNTIQFYDVKQGLIVNSVYGPHICGDAIDLKGDYMLTGSWNVKDQLQLWDMRTFKVVTNIHWEDDKLFYPTYIYSAQFSKKSGQNNLFAVGGSNQSEMRIFENDSKEKLPQIASNNMDSPCYCMDFSNDGKSFAYGCGDGIIRLLDVNKQI
jgi:WD40 repeat protein